MSAPRTDTPAATPPLERLLGYGPALVLPALAALAWASDPGAMEAGALAAGRLWAAAILLFLAGVSRGLSFFTEGGPRWGQLAALALRFWLGLAGLVLPLALAFPVLAAGYAGVALYDPVAARHGSAPRFFARLRPPQMVIAVAGLLALWWRVVAD